MKTLSLVAMLLLTSVVMRATQPISVGLELDVKPIGQSGEYECKAVVTNLDTHEVLSAPNITFRPSGPVSTRTTDGDLVSLIELSMDSANSRLRAEVTVSQAGKVVARQKASLRVQ